ncbi:MAG TPA: hypothetical protein ENI23_15525 [bacterium]|nr:hypothetical protein [bacterium]
MDQTKKQRILKNYLKNFYVKPGRVVKEKLKGHEHKNLVILGSKPRLLEAGNVILLARGRKEYKYVNVHEFVEMYLGQVEEESTMFNFPQSLLLISYGFGEPPNVQLDNFMSAVLARRLDQFHQSVVLSTTKDAIKKMNPQVVTQFGRIDITGETTKETENF